MELFYADRVLVAEMKELLLEELKKREWKGWEWMQVVRQWSRDVKLVVRLRALKNIREVFAERELVAMLSCITDGFIKDARHFMEVDRHCGFLLQEMIGR